MIITLIFFVVVVALGALLSGLGLGLAKKLSLDREKASPFECGFNPKSAPRMPFSLRFFLVALVFLVFDVELVLIFPLVKSLSMVGGMSGQALVWVFLFLLALALFYEMNQGSLNWAK